MLQKIKKSLLITLAGLSLFAPSLAPAFVATSSVGATGITDNLCSGANAAAGAGSGASTTCGNGNVDATNTIQSLASKITKWFSIIVGVIAVVMIIYAGFRYITSGGSSDKVGTAKNALIYAVIGLVIVALAQIIVHFVVNTANGSVPSGT